MTISAFLPVFNEENRISDTLKSLMWCDEIIVIDKNSSDRTVELAREFGSKVKVFFIENSPSMAFEVNLFLKHCTCEWVMLFTASDVIHPCLVKNIKDLIADSNFGYDVLHIPFQRYILGINSKRSPWYSELNPMVFRKSVLKIDPNEIHAAIQHSGKVLKFTPDQKVCMYHLTHETVDLMMDRHIRYWRGEALSEHIDLKESYKDVLKATIRMTIFKKPFLIGYDGLMLMFAFLSYHMMSFVYKWEKKRGSAPEIYSKIKNDINSEWAKINHN